MALPQVATVERWGDVRLAEHGAATEGRVVQANDPRLGGGNPLNVGWTRTYVLDTAPTLAIGSVGEFAFSKDTKGWWIREALGWVSMGYLLSEITNSQAKVITPSGATGTIEVAT